MTDPVIVHEPTKDWALPKDHKIYDDVKLARLKQNMETPIEERIEYATWPETVAYLSSASFDSRYGNSNFEKAYRYSLRQYLDKWTPLVLNEQPEPINQEPRLNDYQLDQLDTLRFGIKKDRDKYFLENQYDEMEIEGVPKKFWMNNYEIEIDQDELDDYSRSTLDDFK